MLTLGGSNMSKLLLLQMSVQCGQYDSYLSNYSVGAAVITLIEVIEILHPIDIWRQEERWLLFQVIKDGSKEITFMLDLEGKADLGEERRSRERNCA